MISSPVYSTLNFWHGTAASYTGSSRGQGAGKGSWGGRLSNGLTARIKLARVLYLSRSDCFQRPSMDEFITGASSVRAVAKLESRVNRVYMF